MKHFVHYFSFGLIVPIAIVMTLLMVKGVSADESFSMAKVSRPYLVQIINPDGSVSEIKGLSLETDPFLIAKELGATPFAEDKFSAFPDIKMGIGSKITLRRAPTHYIKDGKKNHVFRSWAKTVGELLSEKNIELGDDDKINFASNYELEDKMNLIIIRVAITNVEVKEAIDFQITKKEDKTLDEGKTKVEIAGAKGVRTKTYLVRREDGEEISRTMTKNEITTKPVTQVLIIGTKPVITVRCKFNDIVIDAATKYDLSANELCHRMMAESNGNPNLDGGKYKGLFQYEEGFWGSASAKAGYSGASVWDAKAQIYTTAWAWSHNLRGRWPIP